jgi:hypothetical protein
MEAGNMHPVNKTMQEVYGLQSPAIPQNLMDKVAIDFYRHRVHAILTVQDGNILL